MLLPGCRLVAWWPLAPQKGLAQVVRSILHSPTQSTRFYPLPRALLLERSFGIKRLTPPRLRSMNFWRPALMLICSSHKQGDVCPNWVLALVEGANDYDDSDSE